MGGHFLWSSEVAGLGGAKRKKIVMLKYVKLLFSLGGLLINLCQKMLHKLV